MTTALNSLANIARLTILNTDSYKASHWLQIDDTFAQIRVRATQ
jgi:DNA mismatch repair ATPase MutL